MAWNPLRRVTEQVTEGANKAVDEALADVQETVGKILDTTVSRLKRLRLIVRVEEDEGEGKGKGEGGK